MPSAENKRNQIRRHQLLLKTSLTVTLDTGLYVWVMVGPRWTGSSQDGINLLLATPVWCDRTQSPNSGISVEKYTDDMMSLD